jgi:hypothetical protein
LDSSDEQAAAIRRELDGRLQKVAEMEKVLSSRLFSPSSFRVFCLDQRIRTEAMRLPCSPLLFIPHQALSIFLISHLRMRPTRYIPLSGPLASPLQECHVTPDYFLPIVFSRRFSIYHQNDGRSLYGCAFVCLTLY